MENPPYPTEWAAVAFAILLWWWSTGLILFLNRLPRHTFRWSLLGSSALSIAALIALWTSSGVSTVVSSYAAFTSAVLVWGWHEITFLMGFVTGPRSEACPQGCAGWRHFGHAVGTLLYHEVAILATAIVIVLVTWGGSNQVGTWTFVTLWWMRLSAKLNLYLGVPNLGEQLLPDHLRYLERYFTRRNMNLLFPVSITVATALAARLAVAGFGADPGTATGNLLVATLLALAVIEHWFMVLPLPSAELWRWALKSRDYAVDGRRDRVRSS